MLVLGVTGGIGSGKTTVCKLLESKGIPVYYSDERAKYILLNHTDVKAQLMKFFGKEIFTDELPDRQKLAKIVFSDKHKLKLLNSIVHPKVKEDFDLWKKQQNANVIVKEAAILIESGAYKQVDKVLVVTAPLEERIQRVMQRDGVTKQDIQNRLNNQFSDSERIKYADYIVDNSSKKDLEKQLEEILKKLI